MIAFKIDTADVILNDLGDGQGKIIISDCNWGYDFSYYWGAMGTRTLVEFLTGIDTGYFVGKLGPHTHGEINSKKTLTSIRKGIKEYFGAEYPWYEEKEFQADLRDRLKQIGREGFYSPDHFINVMQDLVDDLDYYTINKTYDRENIKSIFKSIFSEPWYYIVYDEHRENIYLKNFHAKLIKELNKNKLKFDTINQI